MHAQRVQEALEIVRQRPAPDDNEPISTNDCMGYSEPQVVGYRWFWRDKDQNDELVITVASPNNIAHIGSKTKVSIWLEDLYIKGIDGVWGGQRIELEFESVSADGPLNPIEGLSDALEAALDTCTSSK